MPLHSFVSGSSGSCSGRDWGQNGWQELGAGAREVVDLLVFGRAVVSVACPAPATPPKSQLASPSFSFLFHLINRSHSFSLPSLARCILCIAFALLIFPFLSRARARGAPSRSQWPSSLLCRQQRSSSPHSHSTSIPLHPDDFPTSDRGCHNVCCPKAHGVDLFTARATGRSIGTPASHEKRGRPIVQLLPAPSTDLLCAFENPFA
jgi:hypothetical protein